MKAEELKPQILAAIDDLNQYLLGNVTGLGLIEILKNTINAVDAYNKINPNKFEFITVKENKTMENLNEGKRKNSKKSYMAELAEIDKQSALVALEAKINKLAEMAEAKTARLAMVNEDENLSELISKQAVKEMQRSIKEIEKLKEKLLKEFTKKGGKMTEVIDEEEKMDEGYGKEKEMEEGYGSTTYEEDDTVAEEEIDEASCGSYEEDDVTMEEEINEVEEEVNRWQKLAGL